MLRGVREGAEHGRSLWSKRLWLAAAVAAPLPVLVSAAREVRRGWVPYGDASLFAVRSRDVFSADPPLVGTLSSRSFDIGVEELHHPGPLYFDLLALPVRLVSSRAAVLVGVALVQALAVVAIAIIGHRRGGPLLGTAAAAMAAALAWSLGSEVLVDPWNPHAVLLPFLAYVMLVWSIADADLWAVPWAIGVGSLVLQTHLAYGLLVPVLGAWGIVALVFVLRRQRGDDPSHWPELRRRVRRAAVVGGVVLFLCWAQPLIEQFTSDGDGNLALLAGGAFDSESSPIGWEPGTRVVATVVAVPPFWLRPSFGDAFDGTWHVASLGLAIVALTLLMAVLGWCWRAARRRDDRTLTSLLATAAVMIPTAVVTARTAHPTPLGVGAHLFRFLWPVGAFVAFTLVVALMRSIAARPEQVLAPVAAFASLAALFVALNFPASNQGIPSWAVPVARDLTNQMDGLEREGPLYVDTPASLDPYGAAVIAELRRRDIPFVVPSFLVGQYGEERRFDGENARAVLYVRPAPSINDVPEGARQVAFARGFDEDEQGELARLEDGIGKFLQNGRLRLNAKGRRVLEDGGMPELERQLAAPSFDPEPLYESREIVKLVQEDLVILEAPWAARFERLADLQVRYDRETVALFLGPF